MAIRTGAEVALAGCMPGVANQPTCSPTPLDPPLNVFCTNHALAAYLKYSAHLCEYNDFRRRRKGNIKMDIKECKAVNSIHLAQYRAQ